MIFYVVKNFLVIVLTECEVAVLYIGSCSLFPVRILQVRFDLFSHGAVPMILNGIVSATCDSERWKK